MLIEWKYTASSWDVLVYISPLNPRFPSPSEGPRCPSCFALGTFLVPSGNLLFGMYNPIHPSTWQYTTYTMATARGDQEPWSSPVDFSQNYTYLNLSRETYICLGIYGHMFKSIWDIEIFEYFLEMKTWPLLCFRFCTAADKAQKCCPSLVSHFKI